MIEQMKFIEALKEILTDTNLEFDNERWVSRTIHIKGIKYVEISKLYFCEPGIMYSQLPERFFV